MQALRNWSFARVLLLCGGWILVCVLTTAAWLFIRFRNFEASTGSGGIGAVSFGINILVLLIPLAPPVMLIVAWLIAHRF